MAFVTGADPNDTTYNLNFPSIIPSVTQPATNDSGDGSAAAILAALLAGNGSGGSSQPDHFFDVSPVDQFTMDRYNRTDAEAARQNQIQNDLDAAKFKHQQAVDDANLALQRGDLALAIKKQNDANYWQGISASIDKERIAMQDRGNQMQLQGVLAGVAQAREASNQQYAVGMANSRNDAERNQIQARWNQEQAAIAKMEDYTRSVLGIQQNQTSQFGAETDRAARMGQLALDQNKFLLDKASSPSDLFGLYFLQRGITPDWQGLSNGQVTQGQAMRPVNPMSAFTPTTAAPDFAHPTTLNNPFAAQVGQATGSVASTQSSAPNIMTYIGTGPGQPSAMAYGSGRVTPAPSPAPTPSLPVFDFAPPQQFMAPVDNLAPRGTIGGLATDNGAGLVQNIEQSTPDYGSMIKNYQDFIASGQRPTALANGGMAHGAFIAGDAPPGSNKPNEELVLTSGPSVVIPIRKMDARHKAMMDFLPHHALGTYDDPNVVQAYQDAGMGSTYIQSSANNHIDPSMLPPKLRMLYDFGAPLPPQLVSSLTGGFSPALNIGNAFNARGLGIAPSLQTLNRQTRDETDLLKGAVQGVGGISFTDFIDAISRPTANLQTAVRSKAA